MEDLFILLTCQLAPRHRKAPQYWVRQGLRRKEYLEHYNTLMAELQKQEQPPLQNICEDASRINTWAGTV